MSKRIKTLLACILALVLCLASVPFAQAARELWDPLTRRDQLSLVKILEAPEGEPIEHLTFRFQAELVAADAPTMNVPDFPIADITYYGHYTGYAQSSGNIWAHVYQQGIDLSYLSTCAARGNEFELTYRITEINDAADGVTYSAASYLLVFTGHGGSLSYAFSDDDGLTWHYSGAMSFTNAYLLDNLTEPETAFIVTKDLTVPKDTQLPEELQFRFEVYEMSRPEGTLPVFMTIPAIIVVDSDNLVSVTDEDENTIYLYQSLDFLAGIEWTAAGVYEFLVKEVDDHVPGMAYDVTEYWVKVYVKATPTGFAVGSVKVYYADPAPAPIEDAKADLIFHNSYPNAPLVIAKEVTGDPYNEHANDIFTFLLGLSAPLNGYVMKDGTPLGQAELLALGYQSIGGPDGEGHYYVELGATANAIYLKGGMQLYIPEAPHGMGFWVAEDEVPGCSTSYTVTINGNTHAVNGTAYDCKLTGDTVITFINRFQKLPDTGLDIKDLPFYGLILLAVGGLAVFAVVKARKRKARKA